MTEDRKHQLDELAVTDILSYLGARVSSMEEHILREKAGLTLLSLWEQTVCEIRGEIKAQETPALEYAKELCDKLEHSMRALVGGPYKLRYKLTEDKNE